MLIYKGFSRRAPSRSPLKNCYKEPPENCYKEPLGFAMDLESKMEEFTCSKCSRPFRTEESWKKHCDDRHVFKCAHCAKEAFDTLEALLLHQKIHTYLRFKCVSSACQLGFASKSELASHKCRGRKGSK